jgi:hypothetical protein
MNAVPVPTEPVKGWFSGVKLIVLMTLVFFVVIVIYHETVGYYVKVGWGNLREWMGLGVSAKVEFDPGETGKPMLSANITPTEPSMLPPADRPLGMPGAAQALPTPLDLLEGGGLRGLEGNGGGKEVFNVSRNIYTFHDAAAVCRAAGGDLASYDQVQDAYESGADWCNYGWVKGQMAVYPTQKSTYEKLQKGDPEYRNACGKPGVNGGYFDNPELRFGVNCYGVKPSKKASDELMESQVALPASPGELEFEKQVQKFREQMDNAVILPFQKGQWNE